MTLLRFGQAMRLRRGNLRDLVAGLLFMAIGTGIAAKARSYTIGVPSNSGPGFFPFYLGLILVGLGAVVAIVALADRMPAEGGFAVRPRAFLWVLLPVVLFGAMLTQGGLVLSTFVAVLLSSLASRTFRWSGTLLNALALSAIVLAAFAYALRLQIPVWPAPLVEWLR